MYVKKQDKINILKWYIKKYYCNNYNLENIDDIKQLEHIIRTELPICGKTDSCNGCHYQDRDFCEKCKNCSGWNWGGFEETKDNYTFRYGTLKKFCEYEMEKDD